MYAKFSSSGDSDIITVNVGEPVVAVPVEKNVICTAGPYFNNYFNGPFKEAGQKTMSLLDVTEASFRIFLKWAHAQFKAERSDGHPPHEASPETVEDNSNELTTFVGDTTTNSSSNPIRRSAYREQFWWQKFCSAGYHGLDLNDSHCCARYSKGNESEEALDKKTAVDLILFPLLDLYIFADKYSIHQLRDDIVTALFYNMIDWEAAPEVTPEITNLAYENLPPSSPFLRYLVYIQAYFGSVSDLEKSAVDELRDHHPEFIFDLMMAQCRRIDNHHNPKLGIAFDDRVGMANSCIFHEHLVLPMTDCRNRMRDCDDLFLDLLKGGRSLIVGSGD